MIWDWVVYVVDQLIHVFMSVISWHMDLYISVFLWIVLFCMRSFVLCVMVYVAVTGDHVVVNYDCEI